MNADANDTAADAFERSADPTGSDSPASGDLGAFWSAAADLNAMSLPEHPATIPTLERLVPSPFPRTGFPLIGLLATVYEHVSAYARQLRDE